GAAASGKLLQFEVGGPKMCVQTTHGVEVEIKNDKMKDVDEKLKMIERKTQQYTLPVALKAPVPAPRAQTPVCVPCSCA
ncbi:lycopene epsiion cyclase, partial [Trifolium pratense]